MVNKLDTAKRRITRLHSDVRKLRWLYMVELRLDANKDISAEED